MKVRHVCEVFIVLHAWSKAAWEDKDLRVGCRKMGLWDGEVTQPMCPSAAGFLRGVLTVSVDFTSRDAEAPSATPSLKEAPFRDHDSSSLLTLNDTVAN